MSAQTTKKRATSGEEVTRWISHVVNAILDLDDGVVDEFEAVTLGQSKAVVIAKQGVVDEFEAVSGVSLLSIRLPLGTSRL